METSLFLSLLGVLGITVLGTVLGIYVNYFKSINDKMNFTGEYIDATSLSIYVIFGMFFSVYYGQEIGYSILLELITGHILSLAFFDNEEEEKEA